MCQLALGHVLKTLHHNHDQLYASFRIAWMDSSKMESICGTTFPFTSECQNPENWRKTGIYPYTLRPTHPKTAWGCIEKCFHFPYIRMPKPRKLVENWHLSLHPMAHTPKNSMGLYRKMLSFPPTVKERWFHEFWNIALFVITLHSCPAACCCFLLTASSSKW